MPRLYLFNNGSTFTQAMWDASWWETVTQAEKTISSDLYGSCVGKLYRKLNFNLSVFNLSSASCRL